MIDICDRNHQPTMAELREFEGTPLFDELCRYMESEYSALCKIEYSGEKAFLGWNVKFKKAGRTLCTVYPRVGHFFMLLIVGRREKERAEALLPSLSEEFGRIYRSTAEVMGQRWLMLDFSSRTEIFEDALKIIRIRREK